MLLVFSLSLFLLFACIQCMRVCVCVCVYDVCAKIHCVCVCKKVLPLLAGV